MMVNKVKSLFSEFMSVNELRMSSLVFSLITCIVASIVLVFTVGTIDQNLVNITLTLIGAITGLNITNMIKGKKGDDFK